MKPITDEEYKKIMLKYRVRVSRGGRATEILEFANSDCTYAELQRYMPTEKIWQEQRSYVSTVWRLTKLKELTPNSISVHVCDDKIIAEKVHLKGE